MKIAELLTEGFMSFTVGGSDSAADLQSDVEKAVKAAKAALKQKTGSLLPDKVINSKLCDAAIEALKKGLKDPGNTYNTHGTLNVAMIMHEEWRQFRTLPQWKTFAGEVAAKLKSEVAARKAKPPSEYTREMANFAEHLEKLSK